MFHLRPPLREYISGERVVRYLNCLHREEHQKIMREWIYQADYLGFDICVGGQADDRKTDEEHVCLRVTQRPKSIIILLTGLKQILMR